MPVDHRGDSPWFAGYAKSMDLSLWSSGAQVGGTVLRTFLLYVIAVVAARVTGRRTLSQMSAFDVVVTIAIGTLVASAALPTRTTVSDGAAALLTLLSLQVAVGAPRQRYAAVERWVDFRPVSIVRDGEMDLPRAPWTAQLTRSDVESRLRQRGIGAVGDASRVVLEPSGRFSATCDDEPGPLFRPTGR